MKSKQAGQNVWKHGRCLACFLALVEIPCGLQQAGYTQITPDTTLGANASVLGVGVLNGRSVGLIKGGAIRSNHLFHSFLEFNVTTNQRIYFENPTGIQNIFTRITGSNPSNISGQLGVNGTANLFLMNPNGILFSPTSSLDVRGSFVATTANGVLFNNGERFTTNPADPIPSSPLLQINPSALLFTQQQTQPITIQGKLLVPTGKSLLFVGGQILVNGASLSAPGGQLEMGGLASSGAIAFDPTNFTIDVPANATRSNVQLVKSSLQVWGRGGGNITLYAQDLDITGSPLSAGIVENTGLASPPQAGDIRIDAIGAVSLREGSNLFNGIFDLKGSPTAIRGSGGQIIIQAEALSIQSRAKLSTDTYERGNAGNIDIRVSGTVALGESTAVRSLVQNGAEGNGGNIHIQASDLSLVGGAQIATSVVRMGSGNGGNINLDVSNSISISGVDPKLVNSSGIPLPSGILVNNESIKTAGDAGVIRINTQRLIIANQGVIKATTNSGNGGNITLNASEYVLLRKGSISTSAGTVGAGGNGGNIRITTPFVVGVLTENSDINANAFTGNGGSIMITAQGIYGLKFQPWNTPLSDITASSQFGLSGSVILNTPDVDPSKSLNSLSAALVDATDQIAEGCGVSSSSRPRRENRFVVTGPGGLPETTDQSFSGDRPLIDLTNGVPRAIAETAAHLPSSSTPTTAAIVEAQGWIVEPNGTVVLVASPQTAIAIPLRFAPATCPPL